MECRRDDVDIEAQIRRNPVSILYITIVFKVNQLTDLLVVSYYIYRVYVNQ